MAGPLYADRVAETATTTGTGTLSLSGAGTGSRTFVSGIGSTNTCYYCISHQTANEWEVGIGTVTSGTPDTLSRTTVLASSNSGSLVSLSAGTKDVFCVAPSVYGLPLIQDASSFSLRRVNESSLSSTVGNSRGNGAVDLQIKRSAANQVASGPYAVIAGGARNMATGTQSSVLGGADNFATATKSVVCGGGNNQATQNYSGVLAGYGNRAQGSTYSGVVCGTSNLTGAARAMCGGGNGNQANGNNSSVASGNKNTTTGGNTFIGGGNYNSASGTYSAVLGGDRGVSRLRAQFCQASGRFSSDGDAQASTYVLRNSTSNATPVSLFLNGSSERISLPNDSTFSFYILVVARRTDADNESACYEFIGCIDRNANAASTALVGSVTKNIIAEDTAAWDVGVTANTTDGAIDVTVTGEAAKTIRWVAYVSTVEVTG